MTTSDHLQWNWIIPAEHVTDGPEIGQANFLTTIEVTGALSPASEYSAMCRFFCLYALSRLNERNLIDACYSLSEIYNWQIEQARLPAPVHVPAHIAAKPQKVTYTKRKPFSFDE